MVGLSWDFTAGSPNPHSNKAVLTALTKTPLHDFQSFDICLDITSKFPYILKDNGMVLPLMYTVEKLKRERESKNKFSKKDANIKS